MEQKNIDRLFQEKLKDIETTPRPEVWNAIEKKLQKKKRRAIPIWWFYGGIAALVLMGSLLLFKDNSNQIKNDFPSVTEKEKITPKVTIDDFILPPLKKEAEIDDKNKVEAQKNATKNTQKSNLFLATKKTRKKNQNNSNPLKQIATDTSKEIDFRGIINSFSKGSSQKNPPFTNKAVSLTDNLSAKKGEQKISEEVTNIVVSSSDMIANKDSVNTKKTSKPKDFIVKEQQPFLLDNNEKLKKKWGIAPVVGILKSNSFSQASALDSDLNSNNFSGENSFSYGVHITYKLNEKWALKSGVQLQTNTFNTNDVPLFTSTNAIINSFDNVVVNNSNNNVSNEVPIINSSDGLGIPEFSELEEGTLSQNYGYVEIPLEVKYTFFSTKNIQTSMVTGFSSLILNKNTISESRGNNLGEASNLRALNFSGNLGLDLDIKLSKNIHFNINPIFKTQLNTFSKNSNGFKPYTIGIYSGLQYNF